MSSYYDRFTNRLKNNRWIAYALVSSGLLVGAGTAIDAITTIRSLLPSPASSSPSLSDVAPIWCRGGVTEYAPDANIAVKLEVGDNFTGNKVKLWVTYPPDPNIPFDENAFMAVGNQRSHLLPLGE